VAAAAALMLDGFSDEYLIVIGLAWLAVILLPLIAAWLQPWRSRRTWLRRTTKAGLCLWTLAFTLLGAETAFALFYDTTDTFALCKTSKRWYERHVQPNNMGYRDRKTFTPRKLPGRHRIVLLGDSFAFGHGIKDPANRFGDLVEADCVAASGGAWELYNISQPGLPTTLMLNRLDHLTDEGFEFDVLLLAYNLNDVEDLDEDSRYIVGTIILDQPSNWVLSECFLPNFLYYRCSQFSRPEVRGYFDWLTSAYEGEGWERQRAQLDELRGWCNRNGIELLVVTFPFLHTLGEKYKFRPAHRTLNDYWRSYNVPVLDLLDVLQPHAAEGLTVNQFDGHPNERAHALAAAAIWEELLRTRVTE
jgi:hypothetical protein